MMHFGQNFGSQSLELHPYRNLQDLTGPYGTLQEILANWRELKIRMPTTMKFERYIV
jgi:hypothetical protein